MEGSSVKQTPRACANATADLEAVPDYLSIDGQPRKIMVVIKMRDGNHAKDIREYEITSKGVVILGKRLTDYQGLISGIPVHSDRPEGRAVTEAGDET
jgi:KaiC/GvpD/RAD55 family RecA-like ATPase